MKQLLLILLVVVFACKSETKDPTVDVLEKVETKPIEEVETKQTSKVLLEDLKAKGFETFNYVDEKTKDTTIMQKYFIAFLKSGAIRTQNEEEAARLQKEHLAHLGRMYDLGYADISGPFGDDGDIRGITIYNVPTLKMADSLANLDPMVKAGRLEIEIHPWWAAKGFGLR
ncbi:YciI family protein [Lacinutrix chionoecetis]